jgi:L-lysine 6-monooxygenase (NADPH-requiring)
LATVSQLAQFDLQTVDGDMRKISTACTLAVAHTFLFNMITIDIAIIGSGPSAVCLLNRLEQRHPSWFPDSKRNLGKKPPAFVPSIKVFDSTGSWMGKWDYLFKSLEIDHLRSPATFHVQSTEGDGLLEYALQHGRLNELTEIPNILDAREKKSRNSKYDLTNGRCKHKRVSLFTAADVTRMAIPSTSLFCDHTRESISANGFDQLVVKANCTGIHPSENPSTDGFRLMFTYHDEVKARCVIVATGGTNVPCIPRAFVKLMDSGMIQHAFDFNNFDLPKSSNAVGEVSSPSKSLNRQKLLVVGGGLTAAQLVIKAVKTNRYSEIILACRGQLTERQFDVPLEWVGRWRGRLMSNFDQTEDAKGIIQLI